MKWYIGAGITAVLILLVLFVAFFGTHGPPDAPINETDSMPSPPPTETPQTETVAPAVEIAVEEEPAEETESDGDPDETLLPNEEEETEYEARPPTLERITELTIDGAYLWLFAVSDGSTAVLSAEQNGEIMMAKFDIRNPSSRVEWVSVITPSDIGGERVADHWHLFDGESHWIVFSTPSAKKSYLLKTDKNFVRQALEVVADNDPAGNTGISTNDMFVVASPEGVDVGHFYPEYGHRIYRFNKNAVLTGKVDIGGRQYFHANGASAEKTPNGFILFAPETLAPNFPSAVRMMEFDDSWQPLSLKEVIARPNTNIVMPSSVLLDSGYRILHARVRTDVGGTDFAGADEGAIVRYILSPAGFIENEEVIVSRNANRPHTALIDGFLITTWDESGRVKMRIDNIETEEGSNP